MLNKKAASPLWIGATEETAAAAAAAKFFDGKLLPRGVPAAAAHFFYAIKTTPSIGEGRRRPFGLYVNITTFTTHIASLL